MNSADQTGLPAGAAVVLFGLGSHPVLGGLYQELVSRGKRRVVYVSLESFPQNVNFTLHQVEGEVEGHLTAEGDELVDFQDIVSVCLDNYQIISPAEGLSEEDYEYRNTESWAALRGLFQCLSSRCLVANHLAERDHFDSRLAELYLLDSYDVPVPRTVATSDPEQAAQFYREVKNVIYRPVNGAHMPFRQMNESDLERLEEVRLSPVHFEEAPSGRLAGVVKVGNDVFLNPRELELPARIEKRFMRLCDDLGLHLAELRLCQPKEGGEWLALGLSPFLTEQGMEDPDAVEAAVRLLEYGEIDV